MKHTIILTLLSVLLTACGEYEDYSHIRYVNTDNTVVDCILHKQVQSNVHYFESDTEGEHFERALQKIKKQAFDVQADTVSVVDFYFVQPYGQVDQYKMIADLYTCNDDFIVDGQLIEDYCRDLYSDLADNSDETLDVLKKDYDHFDADKAAALEQERLYLEQDIQKNCQDV